MVSVAIVKKQLLLDNIKITNFSKFFITFLKYF